jgi:hypothetical protein
MTLQDQTCYFGTLRTDLRLAGVDFFLDFDGADFIGAGPSALLLAAVVLLSRERLRVVFFDDDEPRDLVVERPDVFFVLDRPLFFGLGALVFDCVFGAVSAARARWAAAFVPANTVSMAGTPCFSGST